MHTVQPQQARGAFTIDEWCRYRLISRQKFYQMKKAGAGPKIIKNGVRNIITVEADEAWRLENEA